MLVVPLTEKKIDTSRDVENKMRRISFVVDPTIKNEPNTYVTMIQEDFIQLRDFSINEEDDCPIDKVFLKYTYYYLVNSSIFAGIELNSNTNVESEFLKENFKSRICGLNDSDDKMFKLYYMVVSGFGCWTNKDPNKTGDSEIISNDFGIKFFFNNNREKLFINYSQYNREDEFKLGEKIGFKDPREMNYKSLYNHDILFANDIFKAFNNGKIPIRIFLKNSRDVKISTQTTAYPNTIANKQDKEDWDTIMMMFTLNKVFMESFFYTYNKFLESTTFMYNSQGINIKHYKEYTIGNIPMSKVKSDIDEFIEFLTILGEDLKKELNAKRLSLYYNYNNMVDTLMVIVDREGKEAKEFVLKKEKFDIVEDIHNNFTTMSL